jgi:hypothetical protein
MGTNIAALTGIFTIVAICIGVAGSLVITVAAIAIPFIIIRKMSQDNQNRAAALAAVGTPGQATILSVQDTGMRINDNPRVSMMLEIHLPNYPVYQIQKTITVSILQLAQVQVGAVVNILVDMSSPNNPDKIGIILR